MNPGWASWGGADSMVSALQVSFVKSPKFQKNQPNLFIQLPSSLAFLPPYDTQRLPVVASDSGVEVQLPALCRAHIHFVRHRPLEYSNIVPLVANNNHDKAPMEHTQQVLHLCV
jgi:hypothetical protein